jgi:hypothetical protein
LEQLAFEEVLPKMTYGQVERQVVAMLRKYADLDVEIRSAERKAQGIGIFPALDVAHEKIEYLATVGRAYSTDVREYMHVQKAETLFHQVRGDDEEDERALDEIRGLMIGTRPFGGEAYVDAWGNVVPTIEQAQKSWEWKVLYLKNEKTAIKCALEDVREIRPELAALLEMRYIEKLSVQATIERLQEKYRMFISDRTYDRRKQEAVLLFARFMGLTE